MLTRLLPERFKSRAASFGHHVLDGLEAVRDPGSLVRLALWSFATWGGSILQVLFLAKAFDVRLGLAGSGVFMVVSGLGLAVPTPAGVGGFHATIQFALTRLFGVDVATATTFALLHHAVCFVPITVLGLGVHRERRADPGPGQDAAAAGAAGRRRELTCAAPSVATPRTRSSTPASSPTAARSGAGANVWAVRDVSPPTSESRRRRRWSSSATGAGKPYDRQKVMGGLMRACEKRPVTLRQLEEAAEAVEAALNRKDEREISSEEIGTILVQRLRELDQVAYVRFASVYRRFEDVEEFTVLLDRLRRERGERSEAPRFFGLGARAASETHRRALRAARQPGPGPVDRLVPCRRRARVPRPLRGPGRPPRSRAGRRRVARPRARAAPLRDQAHPRRRRRARPAAT